MFLVLDDKDCKTEIPLAIAATAKSVSVCSLLFDIYYRENIVKLKRSINVFQIYKATNPDKGLATSVVIAEYPLKEAEILLNQVLIALSNLCIVVVP